MTADSLRSVCIRNLFKEQSHEAAALSKARRRPLARGIVLAAFLAGSLTAQSPRKDGERSGRDTDVLTIEPGDSELQKLLKERHNAAVTELRAYEALLERTPGALEPLLDASRRLLKSRLDLADRAEERQRAWEEHLKLAREVEKRFEAGFRAGRPGFGHAEDSRARYARLDAEIHLLRLKDELKGKKGE